MKAPVELTVAADAESMLIVRLTAAGVLARAGATLDRMDQLKSAVEEACTCLVQQELPPERMALRFSCEDDFLVFDCRGCSDPEANGTMDATELEVIRCILNSMADEVKLDVNGGRLRAVRLRCALNGNERV